MIGKKSVFYNDSNMKKLLEYTGSTVRRKQALEPLEQKTSHRWRRWFCATPASMVTFTNKQLSNGRLDSALRIRGQKVDAIFLPHWRVSIPQTGFSPKFRDKLCIFSMFNIATHMVSGLGGIKSVDLIGKLLKIFNRTLKARDAPRSCPEWSSPCSERSVSSGATSSSNFPRRCTFWLPACCWLRL